MKLVNEAVRDIMLYLEQNQDHTLSDNIFEHTVISYTAIADALTPSEYYSIDEVKICGYSVSLCRFDKRRYATQ